MQKQFRDEWLVPLARESHGVSNDFIDAARGGQPFLASALIRAGVVSPDDLGKSINGRYGCRVVRPNPGDIDPTLLSSLSERICRQHSVLPVAVDSSHIHVATANPLDVGLENEIRFAAGRRASLAYCIPDHLEELIARLLNPD